MILKKRCTNCLMPDDYPGITFNDKGVCCYCLGTQNFGITRDKTVREMIGQKDKLRNEFEKRLEEQKGKGEYDCIVPLSGGKDSCYLTYLLTTKYNLKVLAYTLENWVLSPIARLNIENVTAKLNVDHIYVAPKAEFLKNFYGYLLLSAKEKDFEDGGYIETVCSVCSKLILGTALKEAAKREIPFVMSGLGPEQIRDYFYKIPHEEVECNWEPQYLNSRPFMEEDKKYFWNPGIDAKNNLLPQVLFPFHVMEYPNPGKVIEEVVRLGLIKKNNVSPRVTNCHLNWLLQYLDRKRGYEPLVSTVSYRIRNGMGERKKSLIVFELSNFFVKTGIYRHCLRRREIDFALRFLDLKVEDLM